MRPRTSRIAGVVAGAAIIATVGVGAVVSTGYEAIEPRLDGSSVWAVNGASGLVGLVNTSIGALESIVSSPGATEIVQSDDGVLVIDRDASTVRVLDPATGEMSVTVPIQAGADVQIDGERVSIAAPMTGDIWITDVASLDAGAPLSDPIVELGRGSVVALHDSTLFAASPGIGRVLTIDAASGETLSSEAVPMAASSPKLQITAVGDQWVAFDTVSGVMATHAWQTSVDGESIMLQRPGPDADSVVYSSEDGIVRQPIGLQVQTVLAAGIGGTPTRPLVTDECVYGAWASGMAWRQCGDAAGEPVETAGMDDGASLSLSSRGTASVLTDSVSGTSWTLDDGRRIDDWSEPAQDAPSQEPSEDEEASSQSPVAPEQAPPVAEDDALGARPGVVTMLPLLANDHDPNGDPIMISDFDAGGADLELSADGRSLRLSLPADATGELTIPYTITDGSGGEDSATATVSVRGPEENSAPVQVTPATAVVAVGGHAVASVLSTWVDPDGDALVLVDAVAEAPDVVSFRGDGRIELTDGGAGTVRDVTLVVSDGRLQTSGTLSITATDTVPSLEAAPISAVARAGQPITLSPLLFARGGAGALTLHNIVSAPEVDATSDSAVGTITVQPSEPGEVSLEYVVTDGTSTATAPIRIQVLPTVDSTAPPTTVPHAVTVPSDGIVDVDVTATDIDPSGGVLLVRGVETPEGASVRADVVDQRTIRVQLVGELAAPATLRYTVSNGVSIAEGTLVVMPLGDVQVQRPIARDDVVQVRPGSAVDVPVLVNDEQPDGLALRLVPELVHEVEDGGGLLFASGQVLRYVAPEEPGEYTASYAVEGPDGQTVQASVLLQVTEASPATNAPPVAPPIAARVVAGESVDIPVDLSGADPNGDQVQLLGQSSAASLGTITQIDAHTLQYTAGQYSVGTDSIEYEIVDALGLRATGTVRVGVSGAEDVAGAPVAELDTETMRPTSTLAVAVLDNDSDPAGLSLGVISVEPADADVTAEVVGSSVVVTSTEAEGEHGIVITIENSRGERSVSWLRVTVAADAEPPPPVVDDITVGLAAILDVDRVTVDSLAAASVADGESDQLTASLPLDLPGASIDADGVITLDVADRSRVVPFTVTRDDVGLSQTALVLVPGREDSLPQTVAGLQPIEGVSGEPIVIDIDDYVVAATGEGVLLTDASSVTTTHADESNPVVDTNTLRFTPAAGYYGPANISFEVTDGDSPRDPDGRTARIVLPLLILPGDDVPPSVLSSSIRLEPGETRMLDLTRLTSSPDPAELSQLAYGIAGAVPSGFTATVTGQQLTIATAPDAEPGTVGSLGITVDAPDAEGVPGTLRLEVLSSTRPLVQPQADQIAVTRGTQQGVDLLANDEATNPFPETPLTIGLVRGLGGELPPGLSVGISADRATLSVSASPDAAIGQAQVRYQVLDATGAAERAVWGVATIVVQDAPDAPAAPTRVTQQHVDGQVTLAITPPADNNSPIVGYRVIAPGYAHDCGLDLTCTLADLARGTTYRFQVVAVNAIGESEPGLQSEPIRADWLPAAPASVTTQTLTSGEGVVRVAWAAVPPPAGGTPVEGYLVHVTGTGYDQWMRVGSASTSLDVSGLAPGGAYQATVSAVNGAGVPDDMWHASVPVSFTAVGSPGQVSIAFTPISGSDTEVTASWTPAETHGGPDIGYRAVVARAGSAPTCQSTPGGGATSLADARSARLTIPDDQGQQQVYVIADNGWFCSVSASAVVQVAPAPPTGDASVSQATADASPTADIGITATPSSGGTIQYRLGGSGAYAALPGGGQPVAVPTPSGGYGSATLVQIRECITRLGQQLCGQAADLGSPTPLRLDASIVGDACVRDAPLLVAPPENGGASVTVTYEAKFDGGAYAPFESGDPVPADATSVDVRAHVSLDGSQGTFTGPATPSLDCTAP